MAMIISLCSISSVYASSNLKFTDIWARPGDKAGATAVYMNIENPTDNDIELIKASDDIAEMTEMHKTVTEQGISKMVHVDRLLIPAKTTVKLKPKGLHVMIMNLQKDLEVGNEFTLKLFSQDKDKEESVDILEVRVHNNIQ